MSIVTSEERTPEQLSELLAILQAQGYGQASMGALLGEYLSLPGLVGFWPGTTGMPPSSLNQLRDYSKAGQHLTGSGSPPVEKIGSEGERWVSFTGSQYFYVGDTAFNSIIGTETGLESSLRGLTVIAWVKPGGSPTVPGTIMGKWLLSGNQRSWRLRRNYTNGLFLFSVSDDGSSVDEVTATNVATLNQASFVAARFDPSTALTLWHGIGGRLAVDELTSGVPAALFNSTDNLSIGAIETSGTASEYFLGDMSLIALCRAAVPDNKILSLYHMGRRLFGA